MGGGGGGGLQGPLCCCTKLDKYFVSLFVSSLHSESIWFDHSLTTSRLND